MSDFYQKLDIKKKKFWRKSKYMTFFCRCLFVRTIENFYFSRRPVVLRDIITPFYRALNPLSSIYRPTLSSSLAIRKAHHTKNSHRSDSIQFDEFRALALPTAIEVRDTVVLQRIEAEVNVA